MTAPAPTDAPPAASGNPTGTATPAAPPVAAPPVVPPVVPPGVTVAGTPGAVTAPPVNVPTWYSDGPEAAAAYVKRATDQAAELRATRPTEIAAAVEAERQRIGKALGYIKDDGANLTPEQLTERHTADLAARDKKIRDLTVGNALTSALAGTHPGTLDALKGSGRLDDLDPAAADFPTQLQTRVEEYLTANPYFRVTPGLIVPAAPPLTGSTAGDLTGNTPPPPGGELDVDALRKARADRRKG